ncbi:hypothetical protein PFISCL1PPCAC_1872, partial [Pristionchus fissidentatus]
DAEEPHVKAKNLELVQDAFEKTSSLRRLVPPPSLSVYGVPPLPGDLPPPPPTFNDYEINAPAIPPVESDRPSPPVMPKFPPHRYNPLPPTPIPSTPPPPSRILLFRPSSLRKRPDEFIVRSPPTTQFNSPDGKLLSINQLPYRRPFAIPLAPYSPPSSMLRPIPPPPPIPYSPPFSGYHYRTNARVELNRPSSSMGVYSTAPKKRVKVPCLHRQFMHLLYPKWPLPLPAIPMRTQNAIPASRESIRRRASGRAK